MNAAHSLLSEGDARAIALVEVDPDAPAAAPVEVDYATLRSRVSRAAGAWRALGVGAGDRVAIHLNDDLEWVVAYLGVIWAGGVAVALNPQTSGSDLALVLDDAAAVAILTERPIAGCGCRVLSRAEFRSATHDAAAIDPHDADPAAPAFWLYTSGTTGRPKGVVHRHRAAFAPERFAASVLGARASDRFFSSSRLFFAYPLANSLFSALRLGACAIIQSAWPTAANVRATLERTRPTLVFTVPSFYRSLLREGVVSGLADRGVRACVSSGERLPPALREAWREQTAIPLVDALGASETLCLMLTDFGEPGGLRAVPGVGVRPLAGTPGAPTTRLAFEADTIAMGYWRRPDAEALHFAGGRFAPGDQFASVGAERWQYAGREDSMVKLRGRWVDLMDLDERIARAAGATIAEGASVIRDDADGLGVIAYFYVAASADAQARLAEIVAALPPHQRPASLRRIDALPRTATGKLRRRALGELPADE